jgi:hypothetical protein
MSLLKGNFQLHNTRNGTTVVTKEMADISSIRSQFENNNSPYFTFYPKSQKPIKAVIQQLAVSAPAEDISDGLVSLGFDVTSVKQMSTTRRSPTEGKTTGNIPLPLLTLPRMAKSHEIFKLTTLCHIVIRVDLQSPDGSNVVLQLLTIRPCFN